MDILLVRRQNKSLVQTTGHILVFEDEHLLYHCYCLELIWKNNYKKISCIPVGTYNVEKRISDKFGEHFHILNVPGRDFILIHSGNYHSDTQGCILPGIYLQDINKDNEIDVASSRVAMQDLLKLLPEKFKIKIIENYE